MDTVELLLHPVRMRIVQAFLGDRTLTTAALSAELGDIPPGSLYRQIARLVDGGILGVVDERRVRGAVERTYRLQLAAAALTADDLAAMTEDDHRRAFLAYIAGALHDFERYLAHGDIDLARDGVGYHVAGLWLDDDEFDEFTAELRQLVLRAAANGRSPGRTLRLMRTIMLPAEPGAPNTADQAG